IAEPLATASGTKSANPHNHDVPSSSLITQPPVLPPIVSSLPLPSTLPKVSKASRVSKVASHDSANKHHMVTHGKTGNLKPKVFLAHSEPGSVKQALTDPQWLATMKCEHSALMKNETWSLVPLPAHRRAIGCKWVFRIKENPDGSVN
ncbi:retrovirus-related Pol polyprotein from transposon TNT 1-94, partial [Trifolium medium]|nr:retrovirus-related Pol polyprotein from transposon TNT 1-94 [Trifolium medium]